MLLADANRQAPRGEMRGEKKDVTLGIWQKEEGLSTLVERKQFLQNFKQE